MAHGQRTSGKGRTTCGYFLPDSKHIIYASTHLGGDSCPRVPDRSKFGNKYIWPIYKSYDIYMADLNGKIVKKLTNSPGYDAEGTISPDGSKMAEPRMNVQHVADAILYMANLPLDANVQFMTIMATKMPFVGRG